MRSEMDDPGERSRDIEGMKPLRLRLEEARKRLRLPWEVLERDYLLSWILAGITQVEILQNSLVFKGGTALKKCYFGDYRFSEDLDFTGVGSVPTGTAMEAAVKEACVRAVQLLDPYAPVEILCERHTEREPHPGSQKPSTSAHASPGTGSPTPVSWSRSHWTRRYSDPHCDGQSFTTMESHSAWRSPPILLRKSWLRNSEPSSSTPGRLRAGAGSRARDYYDLWRILGASPVRLD